MSRTIFIICALAFLPSLLVSQVDIQQTVSLRLQETPIVDAFRKLSQAAKINIIFSDNFFEEHAPVSMRARKWPIKRVLNRLLKKTSVSYSIQGNQIVLYKKEQSFFTIRGYVKDKENGEALLGATVAVPELGKGAYTNEYGFFSLTLPKGNYEVFFSYMGYETKRRFYILNQNKRVRLQLSPSLTLAEIVVKGYQDVPSIDGVPILHNAHKIFPSMIDQMPALGGESDVFRMSHYLPGVQTGADGLGGLHIRGGSADQNLILFDGAPVYNPSHALGLFSIFAPETIRSFQLLKGNFPARYGGRLSSVIDVRTREGNSQSFRASISTGLIASKGLLEGPLKTNKGGFIILFRRTHLDHLLKSITGELRNQGNQRGFYNYSFQDILLKTHYEISDRDRIYLSFYEGTDHFFDQKELIDQFEFEDIRIRINSYNHQKLNWGNRLAVFRWNREWSKKTFAKLSATYSTFQFRSQHALETQYYENEIQKDVVPLEIMGNRSKIVDRSLQFDLTTHFSPSIDMNYGVKLNQQTFAPAFYRFQQDSSQIPPNTSPTDSLFSDETDARTWGAYVESNIALHKAIHFNIGLRLDAFQTGNQTFWGLQPRLKTTFLFSKKLQAYASVGKMTQFMHVLTNTNFGLPEDTWVPANAVAPPQQAVHYETGLQYKFDRAFSIRLDAYYKDFDQLIDLKPGIQLFNQSPEVDSWEESITHGRGFAYGVELFLEKKTGKLTGSLGYTWSKAKRQFDNVNNNELFFYRYDRRHNIQFLSNYQLNSRFSFSLSWLMGSGHLVSLPVGQYSLPEGPVFIDYEKNNHRLRANHRLDVSMKYKSKRNWGFFSCSVGLYNVYNRRNPFNLVYQPSYFVNQRPKFVEVSLLPILPYFSVNFELN